MESWYRRMFKNKLRDKLAHHIDEIIAKHSLLSIIIVYNSIILITVMSLYKSIPILLCYVENVQEYSRAQNFSYDLQFIVATFFVMVLSTFILRRQFKDIAKYGVYLSEGNVEKLEEIRKKCMNLPYIIYLCQIYVPFFIATLVMIVSGIVINFPIILMFKLCSIVFSFCFLSAIVSYTFSRRIFIRILYNTYKESTIPGFRIKIGSRVLMQIIPMIVTVILITALLGYSRLIEEKGNLLFDNYRYKLEETLKGRTTVENTDQLFRVLKNVKVEGIKTTYFVKTPDGHLVTTDNVKFPEYYMYFINHPVDGLRVYGYTKETQGVIEKFQINQKTWKVGVYFEVESPTTVKEFAITLIILLFINITVIYCFSKSISDDITRVADCLSEVGELGKLRERRVIPVISNDEIGDLVVAYNKIQQFESEYDTMKNEFFANVSHELRTPLNIILASVQLLSSMEKAEEGNQSPEKVEKIAEMIKQNSYRLLRLVNNLIDSSKISASFYDVHMKNHNIVNVVEDISLSVASYIEDKGIEFLFDTEIEERVMICDADMIERIMLNLLSNAVKFTSQGGSILVSMREENENVIISVRDSGIGMNEEEQKEIFERFRQVDKSLTRRREGSGIGLSLVKSLVEMHKGTVSVKSEPGKGTEFIVVLPVIASSDEVDDDYLEKQIYNDKVQNDIEKIKIEFSDIYF